MPFCAFHTMDSAFGKGESLGLAALVLIWQGCAGTLAIPRPFEALASGQDRTRASVWRPAIDFGDL